MTNRFIRFGERALRSSWTALQYQYYMKNGVQVWWNERRNKALPPLELRDGSTLHHGPFDEPVALFREVYVDRFYESLDAPRDAHVVDIGANIGAVTLYWARSRPDIHFHAYEPNPQSYEALRKNVEANGLTAQVTTYREAVGFERGKLDIWTDVPTTLATAYGDAPVQGATRRSVPMISLDDVWDRMGRAPIWMLKIDTEGAEGDILDGASDTVLANVETACIEWHENIVPGVFERCRQRLEDANFVVQTRAHPWNEGIFFAAKPHVRALSS